MRNFAIAKVYASALLDLARDAGELDELARFLVDFRDLLESNGEMREVFLSPELGFEQKRAVIEDVIVGAPELLRRFLLLLVQKHREPAYADIVEVFEYLRDTAESRLRGKLATARPLDDSQRIGIERALGESTGKKVRLQLEVDEKLLAGLVLTLDGRTLDGSLKTRLGRMKDRLTAVELGKE